MQMQCLACGAEMRVIGMAGDSTMAATGLEHRTFACAACGDIERRLVLRSQLGQRHSGHDALHAASTLVPQNEAAAVRASGTRTLTRLYRVWRAMARRKPTSAMGSDAGKTQQPAPLADMPEPFEPAPGLSPALPHLPLPLPTVPSASMSPRSDNDLDECEVLPRRAIEMVHGETHPGETTPVELASTTPATVSAPVPAASGPLPDRQKSAPIAVQIQPDPVKGRFVVRDARSGLSILRHQDSAWLRAMCDRMGWRIVEGAAVDAGE
jgi:hypothetical protein